MLELLSVEVDVETENIDQDSGLEHLKHLELHTCEGTEVLGVEEKVVDHVFERDEDTGCEDLQQVLGLEGSFSLTHHLLEEEATVNEDAVLDIDSLESSENGSVLPVEFGSVEGLLGESLVGGAVVSLSFTAVGAEVVEGGLLLFLEYGLLVLRD